MIGAVITTRGARWSRRRPSTPAARDQRRGRGARPRRRAVLLALLALPCPSSRPTLVLDFAAGFGVRPWLRLLGGRLASRPAWRQRASWRRASSPPASRRRPPAARRAASWWAPTLRSTAPLSDAPSPEPLVADAARRRRRGGAGASTGAAPRPRRVVGGLATSAASSPATALRNPVPRAERGHRRRRHRHALPRARVAARPGRPGPALEHAEPGEGHRVAGPDGVDDDLQQGVDGGGRGLPVAEAVGQRVHELGLVHERRR